jgi:hypothetical protein
VVVEETSAEANQEMTSIFGFPEPGVREEEHRGFLLVGSGFPSFPKVIISGQLEREVVFLKKGSFLRYREGIHNATHVRNFVVFLLKSKKTEIF